MSQVSSQEHISFANRFKFPFELVKTNNLYGDGKIKNHGNHLKLNA